MSTPGKGLATIEERKKQREAAREAALDEFTSLVGKALLAIEELVDLADSEAVRLQAAQTILKMAQVDPGSKKDVNVTIDDKRIVKEEMQGVLERLQRNNPEAVAALIASEELNTPIDVESEEL